MGRAYWAGNINPGEIALYHFLGKTRVMCRADGTLGPLAATKFSSGNDAETYARKYVEVRPDRGCRLYDDVGRRLGEIRGASAPAHPYSRKDARRDVVIGTLAFLAVPIGILIAKWIGWALFLGMIIGTKFVLLGIFKLADGIAGLMDPESR